MGTPVYVDDSYVHVRRFCMCPQCGNIWTHRENRAGGVKAAIQEAKQRYEGARQCPECGAWSESVIPGFFSLRLPRRELCEPPSQKQNEVELE